MPESYIPSVFDELKPLEALSSQSVSLSAIGVKTATGVNLLTGTTAWLDLNNLVNGSGIECRDIALVLLGNTTNIAGTINCEGSNDGVTPVLLNYELNGAITNSSITIASATQYQIRVLNTGFRFLKVGIVTPFTGTSPGVSAPFIYAIPSIISTVPNRLVSPEVGSQSDIAQTNPLTPATLLAYIKGILTLAGATTETAPISDTAASGTNGRLQRISQRITSLIGLLPVSLGAGTSAQSLKVVLPSDQVAIPTRMGLTDYVQTSGNNTSTQLTAAATFTGAIESALNYPQILVSVRCDQPYRVTVKQYSDASGTIAFSPDIAYTREAGVSLNQSINIVASYFQVLVQNTGTAATTTLFAETWLGILPPLPNLTNTGNLPVSLPKKINTFGPTVGATAFLNILDPTGLDVPTDVSELSSAIIFVTANTTGRSFQLNGGWDAANVGINNIPMFDMAFPQNPAVLGAQATASTFNKAYYVNLTGINFIQITLTAGAALVRARLVASQTPFSLSNFAAQNQLAAPSTAIADIASSTISAVGTTLSPIITPTWGVSQSFTYTVTAITGTPSLIANIQESLDGVNYSTIATLTMTTTGTFSTNLTAIQGRFYRYQEIFAGAASSITRSVSRTQSNEQAPIAGKPVPFTTLNTSGTANTSTLALAANPARKYLFIQNLSASPMFITTGATAVNNAGIRLAANGGSQEFATNGLCPTNAIQIICPAAATQPYTVVEM
jgi:hypothetical protein